MTRFPRLSRLSLRAQPFRSPPVLPGDVKAAVPSALPHKCHPPEKGRRNQQESYMTKLLATTAVALVALAGAASAQSVLERVLSKIDNSNNLAKVNGTFANIAENIGGVGQATVYVKADGSQLSSDSYETLLAGKIDSEIAQITYDETNNTFVYGGVQYATALLAANEAKKKATKDLEADYTAVKLGVGTGIDGSITNIVDGLTSVTQQALANTNVSAIEYNMPTFDFGDMSTTVLGAVNTGEITLGVNQAVDEAKTSSTGALSAIVDQIGGTANTGAIVLNVASNMTGVNGSIYNKMEEVNGSVGNAATTVLGAVNTGTITSGVNAAVAGIVSTGSSQN